MKMMISFLLAIFCLFNIAHAKEFNNFSQAKKFLIKQVNADTRTIYCGCKIIKQGKKLIPDAKSCGYVPRKEYTKSGKLNARATRIEWEHIVPAWEFGHQLKCWQNGGRKNCRKVSSKFREMEADIHNLAPAVGELNADRSNYRFGMLGGERRVYGACDVEIDFKQRVIEPPIYSRKKIAETYFYMAKKYGLKISKRQKQLYSAWLNTKS